MFFVIQVVHHSRSEVYIITYSMRQYNTFVKYELI